MDIAIYLPTEVSKLNPEQISFTNGLYNNLDKSYNLEKNKQYTSKGNDRFGVTHIFIAFSLSDLKRLESCELKNGKHIIVYSLLKHDFFKSNLKVIVERLELLGYYVIYPDLFNTKMISPSFEKVNDAIFCQLVKRKYKDNQLSSEIDIAFLRLMRYT